MTTSSVNDNKLKSQLAFGGFTIFLLVVLVLFVGATIEITGAVIAPGQLAVESKSKRVQHQDGGIVEKILVREGDLVERGDLLIRLDETLVGANYAMLSTRLMELSVVESRLNAELSGESQVQATQSMELATTSDQNLAALISNQQVLLEARLSYRSTQADQLNEQIAQLEIQIEGLDAQWNSKSVELELVEEELRDFSGLLADGFVEKSRIMTLKRTQASLQGEIGGLKSSVAQARQAIAERHLQISQIDNDMRGEVVEQLSQVRSELSQLREKKIAAKSQLDRMDIWAPQSGIVHQLEVHTIGRVIGPGETIMLIVPESDRLIIEARVQPTDVDSLSVAQTAVLKFTGLDPQSAPEIAADVANISADVVQDEISGNLYYEVQLVIQEQEFVKLARYKLIPGMPVEAYIQTEARTILSFLMSPLLNHIERAFRET